MALSWSGPRLCEFGAWPQKMTARRLGSWSSVLLVLQHRVVPARDREAVLAHHLLVGVLLLQPVEIDVPHPRPVLERTRREAVVARQRLRVRADVGRALHVVVAAVDVGAAARDTDVAQRQHQDRARAHDRVAVGVLRLAHRPDDEARPVVGQHLRGLVHFLLGHAGDVGDDLRRVLRHDLFLDLVHAVDALGGCTSCLPSRS